MSQLSKFTEAFWGSDFLSPAGFDALLKRIHDGKSLCKEMEAYLKQRSKIEIEYSKNLTKLHQSLKFRSNIGQLEESWNVFQYEITTVAKIHRDCGIFLQKQGEDTHKYIDENSTRRKEIEDRVKKSHHNKVTTYTKTTNLKKAYQQRCKESDIASETFRTFRSGVTGTSKDFEKAQNQDERALEQKRNSDEAYKTSIQTLEVARSIWEQEMTSACEAFQVMEEGRISYLRDLAWTCANVQSSVSVDVDNSSEVIRNKLDTCDIEQDICMFIEQFQTGTNKPLPIQYENYYNKYENMCIRM